MEIETVKVAAPVVDGNPHGYIVINKSDLTAEHEIFVEKTGKRTAKGKAVNPTLSGE